MSLVLRKARTPRALEQQHLQPALTHAGLPVHDLDHLPVGAEGLLRRASPVLDDQPHEARLADLELELEAAAAPHPAPDLLGRLAATDRVQREDLAGHRGRDATAHNHLLGGRVVAHLLGRDPALQLVAGGPRGGFLGGRRSGPQREQGGNR
jgi:hypothetical protein